MALTTTHSCLHAQTSPGYTPPDISYSVLPNGVRVIVEPRHTVAIVAIDIWVEAGTRLERPGEEGAAHYLEHLIFTGTPTHPDDGDIDGAIEDLGGSLDAATSYDWAHFYTTVPSDSMSAALGVVGDAVQHASLTSASVESERPIILDEIDRTSDDPASLGEQSVRSQIFGSNAYGRPITGTHDQVQALQQSTIAGFYHRCYVPQDTAVVIVGDTTVAAADAAAQAVFGAWSGVAPPEVPSPPAIGQVPYQRRIINRDGPETTLVMGWPAPSVVNQPDAWVMDVLLTYLGQGGVDLLDTDLRVKQKLVTAIQADYLTQHDPGLMTVTATLNREHIQAAEQAILQDVAAVQNTPLTDAQLASAKEQLIASYLFDTETVSGRADSLGFYEMIDSYTYDQDYLNNVNSVTAQQVQQVAQKYLSTTNYAETIITASSSPDNASVSDNTGDPAQFFEASGQLMTKRARVD